MIDPERAKELILLIHSMATPPWRPIPSIKVAKLLGVSLQSLANWRVRGCGPPSEPVRRGKGNKVFYNPTKIVTWLANLSGEHLESWKVSRDWLKKNGLELCDPNEKSFSELTSMIDRFKIL